MNVSPPGGAVKKTHEPSPSNRPGVSLLGNEGLAKKNSGPTPPKDLSVAAKRWWREIEAEYGIEDAGGLLVLQSACEAFDRMRQAQAILAAEGLVTRDRFGQAKVHPAAIVERDSRAQLLAAIKQLNLDLEPLKDRPGRPMGTPPLLRKV